MPTYWKDDDLYSLFKEHSQAVRASLKTTYPNLRFKVKIDPDDREKRIMVACLMQGNKELSDDTFDKTPIEKVVLQAIENAETQLNGLTDKQGRDFINKMCVAVYLGEPWKKDYVWKNAESSATTYNAEMDANVLFRQLGGNRFRAMTGAKDFMKDGNSLRMKIMKNNTGGNHLIITLNSNDLYDMRFESHRMNRKTYELTIKVKAEEKNIPASDLQRVFTRLSGLYTRMAEQSFSADNKNPITQKMIYNMKQTLDSIWRSGDMDEVSIKHIWYSLGALGDGRDWNTQTDYTSMNDMNKVKRQWKKIQAKRDELGIENFKKLIELIPNYGSALSKRTISPDLAKIIGQTEIDGWDDFSAESFNAEIDGEKCSICSGNVDEDMDDACSYCNDYICGNCIEGSMIKETQGEYIEETPYCSVKCYQYHTGTRFDAESFNADDLKFKEWADQEMKTHGKKESFDDWLDDELESHGDNVSLQNWGHHELDSHYERYGAEDEQIELKGNDGPEYTWDDLYYNCPLCDERMEVYGNPKMGWEAICEFSNHSDIGYSPNMLESFDEFIWFHNVGAHENRRNDYKDPEKSDEIPVCGVCDFSQSYSPDNMVEKDDGSWNCQSCGEITESFNAETKEKRNWIGFCPECQKWRDYEEGRTYKGYPVQPLSYLDTDLGVWVCNKQHTYFREESAYENRGYYKMPCGEPLRKSKNANAPKIGKDKKTVGASAYINESQKEMMKTIKMCMKYANNNTWKDGKTTEKTFLEDMLERLKKGRDLTEGQAKVTNRITGNIIRKNDLYWEAESFNAETKSLPYKWIAGAIALGISLPYISSLLNSGREK